MSTRRFITRMGQQVTPDAVFDAWSSADLTAMRAAVAVHTNPVDRHHLLQSLVEALYRRRSEAGIATELLSIAWLHIQELPELLAGLEADKRATYEATAERAKQISSLVGATYVEPEPYSSAGWPLVSTFDRASRVLCERREFERAKDVWRAAARTGYLDADQLDVVLSRVEKDKIRAEKKSAKEKRTIAAKRA
ncbi:UNVERIFIED_ORG: hypothetical protein LHJ69_14270 [Shinella sp. XGS7]|nr:hypothetical protein [Shinella sp. XGS7]